MSLVLGAGALTGILLPSDRPVRISRELCFWSGLPGNPLWGGQPAPDRVRSADQ